MVLLALAENPPPGSLAVAVGISLTAAGAYILKLGLLLALGAFAFHVCLESACGAFVHIMETLS